MTSTPRNPDYWHNVQRTVGNSPSTYHLILPEAFINASDRSDRIAKIKSTMKTYVDEGILAQLPRGIVLVERTVGSKKRKGIMLTIDLEEYDFQPGNRALCRATRTRGAGEDPAPHGSAHRRHSGNAPRHPADE